MLLDIPRCWTGEHRFVSRILSWWEVFFWSPGLSGRERGFGMKGKSLFLNSSLQPNSLSPWSFKCLWDDSWSTINNDSSVILTLLETNILYEHIPFERYFRVDDVGPWGWMERARAMKTASIYIYIYIHYVSGWSPRSEGWGFWISTKSTGLSRSACWIPEKGPGRWPVWLVHKSSWWGLFCWLSLGTPDPQVILGIFI